MITKLKTLIKRVLTPVKSKIKKILTKIKKITNPKPPVKRVKQVKERKRIKVFTKQSSHL